MFVPLLILFVHIDVVISFSHQQDLSVDKYNHIGCLAPKSDFEFVVRDVQERSALTYQTFSSSSMNVELCFRLCRRWTILMFKNNTNCICLYVITEQYELNRHLGSFVSIENCTSKDARVYALTTQLNILPSPSSPATDWSLDGCYYLHGIQTVKANFGFANMDYERAIDQCREHCQVLRATEFFSFFVSRKKSCYCLPIQFSQSVTTIALRKPLIHCSFLSYICNAFHEPSIANINCNNLVAETNVDTVVKIDVQRFCSGPFIFDRYLHLCLKLVALNLQTTYSSYVGHICSPIQLRTREQWNYLISSTYLSHTSTFIWIHSNSTFVFDQIKYQNKSSTNIDLCLVFDRTRTTSQFISNDLVPCTQARWPSYVLCAQQPPEVTFRNQDNFNIVTDDQQLSLADGFTCPPGFVSFNGRCYFVYTSFVYTIRSGERLCQLQYSNSTLVKFDSHDWGNVNATRFLGRAISDVLLEFFYHELEKKLDLEPTNNANQNSSSKHWLRLLIGDTKTNECVLRYFARASGAFTVFHRCSNGGHPVCQSDPIRIETTTTTTTKTTKTSSIDSSTITFVTSPPTNQTIVLISTSTILDLIVSNTTDVSFPSNESVIPVVCENCTMHFIADEDLVNNETVIDRDFDNLTSTESRGQLSKAYRRRHRIFIILITGPLLALMIAIIGIILLSLYLKRSRGSYSTRSSIISPTRRSRRSSTMLTTNDIPATPTVVYNRLKAPTDDDLLLPFDNTMLIDDNVELLPAISKQLKTTKEEDEGIEEEPLYATLNERT